MKKYLDVGILILIILNIVLSLINLNLKSNDREPSNTKSKWPEQWGKVGKNVLIIDENKVPYEIKIAESQSFEEESTKPINLIAIINLLRPVKGLKITLEDEHISIIHQLIRIEHDKNGKPMMGPITNDSIKKTENKK